ncbi:MAG: DUF3530 family protein [Idiomarina sp.]|nr:DUF3530 family protein [Idiomarina sp.]
MARCKRYCLHSFTALLAAALSLAAAQVALAAADDLAYYLPPGEVVWLGASEDALRAAAEDEQPTPLRMLLLARENEQAYDRGSLIFIPELGTHPMQSVPVRLWYQGMPAYGWYSYAIQPPTAQVIEFSWQEDSSQRYAQGADLTPLHDAMAQRLSLAVEHAAHQPGPLIIVAQGVSAALVTDLLARGDYPQIDALVMVGAHYPQWQLNQALATTTAQLRIPVLDFIPQHSHSWVLEHSARRQQQTQRHQHPSYRQRTLLANRANDPRYLIHQLYGWLQSEDF